MLSADSAVPAAGTLPVDTSSNFVLMVTGLYIVGVLFYLAPMLFAPQPEQEDADNQEVLRRALAVSIDSSNWSFMFPWGFREKHVEDAFMAWAVTERVRGLKVALVCAVADSVYQLCSGQAWIAVAVIFVRMGIWMGISFVLFGKKPTAASRRAIHIFTCIPVLCFSIMVSHRIQQPSLDHETIVVLMVLSPSFPLGAKVQLPNT